MRQELGLRLHVQTFCCSFDGNEEQKALFSELSYRVVNSRIEKYTRILHPVIPQLHDILKNPPVVSCFFSTYQIDLRWVRFFSSYMFAQFLVHKIIFRIFGRFP